MSSTEKRGPLLLAILDGLGLNPNTEGNAVAQANTPTLDSLLSEWPNTTLTTYGEQVGLPQGQMGNSEVGHMNIGAGRAVEQVLTRIDRVVREDNFDECEPLVELLQDAARQQSAAVHFIGLVSTGGVHSQLSHLSALVREALRKGVAHVYIHAITDGRDRPQDASLEEIAGLEAELKLLRDEFPKQEVRIASVIGRYYAMDRDKRWERTARAFQLFTQGEGEEFPDALSGIKARHEAGQTDEFIEPIILPSSEARRAGTCQDGDSVLFFNFRSDRMRQLVPALCFSAEEFQDFERPALVAFQRVATMTEYEESFPVEVLFGPPEIKFHLGEVLANAGLRQLRIAETEKYPHVTYFFNGGVEQSFEGEKRILVPSPRDVATYDLKPQMSAEEITEKLLEVLKADSTDVVVLNFANCDMVGHTGVFEAAKVAAETVDACLGRLLETLDERGGVAVIIADHGNAEQMIDYDSGEPHTYHTLHPVPCILYGKGLENYELEDGGALEDVAPSILDLLGIPAPEQMKGKSLIKKK